MIARTNSAGKGRSLGRISRWSTVGAVVLALVATVVACSPVHAKASRDLSVELGWMTERFQRDVAGHGIPTREDDWAHDALFMRLEIAGRLGLSIEGMVAPPTTYENRSGRRYRYTTVGGSLWGYPIIWREYKLGLSARFWQTVWLDESRLAKNTRYDCYELSAKVVRKIDLRSTAVSVWAGPVFSGQDYTDYYWCGARLDTFSREKWGVLLGGSLLVLEHFAPFIELSHVHSWEPRIGASYRF